MKSTILITGANGYIASVVREALQPDKYDLIWVDKCQGQDINNRFGLENVETHLLNAAAIQLIDLSNSCAMFEELVVRTKPDCIIHLAGVLESQAVEAIQTNREINRNVLEVCAKYNIKLIAASSIMVMYGAAMTDKKIKRIFARELLTLEESEKLTVDTPFNNTVQTIKQYDLANYQNNLEYILGKMAMETSAQTLVNSNPELTMVAVRFGWSGAKNPYELESDKSLTEIPGYLCQEDLQSFMLKIVQAVLSEEITGYKCYAPVSLHAQNWVSIKNAEDDLGWAPAVDVVQKYQPTDAHSANICVL